ncbi:unnamed protein product [Rhizoctonia solani]|uniref:Transmembrane protein n=1 Tax=Rhizoctonia solani TaxID=456999 RepID=A0A8H3H2Q7_9AGAM|nr:unnamed protein product [Rhizoctonia solani]
MTNRDRPLQTPGAGSSRSRPSDIFVPPARAHLPVSPTGVRIRTPTRSTTSVYEEVELGLYLHPVTAGTPTPTDKDTPGSRRGSLGSITSKVTDPGKDFFLSNSIWRTDIITFCSHVRAHSSLRNARITHVQARKSRRLPFMHEYLLVFFTSPTDQRFVIRIDRLGKALGSTGEPTGPTTGAGTAIQEVGLYHVQDSQHSIDSTSGVPWLAMDGMWGSHPVVTLVAWDMLNETQKQVSHHTQSAKFGSSQRPRLRDVSGILEGILVEMPNYHLTTANCYLMTRSSLILLHRCCPTAFACYLGPPSSELISASLLAEPVWAGLLRWYLPFMVVFFMVYYPLLVLLHQYMAMNLDCAVTCNRLLRSVMYALHSILDVPLPIGIIHCYMTSLELQINRLVVDISTQFFRIRSAPTEPMPETMSRKPFEVIVDDAWLVLMGWIVLGGLSAVLLFLATAVDYGILGVFICVLIGGVWFNFKFGSDGALDLDGNLDNVFGPPPVVEVPEHV